MRSSLHDLGDTSGIRELLDEHDDQALATPDDEPRRSRPDVDYSIVFAAFTDDRPTCFIAYTIKGYGLPFAGHKDNHAGMMTAEQVEQFKQSLGIDDGDEWDRFAGLDVSSADLQAFLDAVPLAQPATRRHRAPRVAGAVDASKRRPGETMSTQQGFGRLLADIGRAHPDARRPYRDDVARRDRLDQPGRVGEPSRHF